MATAVEPWAINKDALKCFSGCRVFLDDPLAPQALDAGVMAEKYAKFEAMNSV